MAAQFLLWDLHDRNVSHGEKLCTSPFDLRKGNRSETAAVRTRAVPSIPVFFVSWWDAREQDCTPAGCATLDRIANFPILFSVNSKQPNSFVRTRFLLPTRMRARHGNAITDRCCRSTTVLAHRHRTSSGEGYRLVISAVLSPCNFYRIGAVTTRHERCRRFPDPSVYPSSAALARLQLQAG
jgi:hypothetical protein